MLPSLGQLNADLLTVYYGSEPAPSRQVSSMLRQSTALLKRARRDAQDVANQERVRADEAEMVARAGVAKHIAKHTQEANTMCTGPCVHIPPRYIQDVTEAATQLPHDRVKAIGALTSLLINMPSGTELDPVLCQSTGLVCEVMDFDRPVTHTSRKMKRAERIVQEAEHTHSLAKLVANSQVRELEAGCRTPMVSTDLRVRESSREAVRDFFAEHSLGTPPDTDNIRVAINHVGSHMAPRVRDTVTTDLWSRWLNF